MFYGCFSLFRVALICHCSFRLMDALFLSARWVSSSFSWHPELVDLCKRKLDFI